MNSLIILSLVFAFGYVQAQPGGYSDYIAVEANDYVGELTLELKDEVESALGETFKIFVPIVYRVQTVAGANYDVDVAVDEGRVITVKFFVPLDRSKPELRGIDETTY